MRIKRLDLIRYGRFTDASLEMPEGQPDIHLVVGPNEAGKSTMMEALGDLLFGIPQRSTQDFQHKYASMKLGAVLEADQQRMEVRRRKGFKNTLLGPDDAVIAAGEHALEPYRGSTSREFFERMFSLDHERLRRGGQAILEDRDEVGSMLFSAGSAIQDLQGRLRALDEEANALWSYRRSAKREFYKAADRLKRAETALREHTVTASKWFELQRDLQARQDEYDELLSSMRSNSSESRKLSRIRRVARYVRDKASLEVAISELGSVRQIPDDARKTLENAEQAEMLATVSLREQGKMLERAKQARRRLAWDDSLLLREKDVERLNDRRIQMQEERADLPKREAELAAAEARIRDLATEFGWQANDVGEIIERIPRRTAVTQTRSLLNEGLVARERAESTGRAVLEAEGRLREAERQLDAAGMPSDARNLAALVKATNRDAGDIDSQITAAELDVARFAAESTRLYRSMRPLANSIESAISMGVPDVAVVQDRRDARRTLDQRLAGCREQIRSSEGELAGKRDLQQRILTTEQPVSETMVERLRSERDKGWSLIRRKYLDGEPVSDSALREFSDAHPDTAAAYEAAVRAVDETVDRRFQTAEATARLAEAIRSATECERQLEQLRTELEELTEESDSFDAHWHELWARSEIEPLSPDEMLPWLATRENLVDCAAKHAEAKRRAAALEEQRAKAIDRIISQLRAVSANQCPSADQGLRTLLEFASEVIRRHEQAEASKRSLELQVRKVEIEAEDKRADLSRENAQTQQWQLRWSAAVGDLGLDPSLGPDAIGQQLDLIDETRSVADKAADLRIGRVGKIRRDLEGFEGAVQTAIESIAPDLGESDPDAAVLELHRRLAHARQARKDAEAKDSDIAALQERIDRLENDRRLAAEAVLRLQAAAGAADIDGLRQEIEKIERLQELEFKRNKTLAALRKEGDGFSIEDLIAECDGVDLDQAALREEALAQEGQQIQIKLMEARDALNEARNAFEAVGGSDAAAVAETVRQSALADMRGIAEQYVRTRTAALIVRWAIDRNRNEKQGPLLRAAGNLFSELTSGSFENLEVDFDDQDRRRLVGRRPEGARVEVGGMSEGTVDQLYLAVRIAALEQYLENAPGLPFIADDLFVNFDDQRAKAGFRALGHLARKCQVIFLTHHEHLVSIAQAALPQPIPIQRLS